MDQQQHIFMEQFHAMDTALLLQRYRHRGLIPDAEAALLSVLESRGYPTDRLDEELLRIDVATANRKAAKQEEERIAKDRQAADPVFKKINLTLRCFISPVIVFFLLLAIPILGNVIVLGGAGLLGCNTGEDAIHPCILLGSDLGSFVYGYIVDAFLAGGLNPILAVMGFLAFLHSIPGMVWLLTSAGLFAARETRRFSFH